MNFKWSGDADAWLRFLVTRDSEYEMWSSFVSELVIWPQEITLARWTQPSGPLCLWQCFNKIYFLYLAPIKKIIDIFILVLLCRRWYDAYDVFQYDQKNANLFADIWEHSCGGLHFRRGRFLKTIKIIFPSFYVAVISSLKEEIEFSFQTTPIDAYCLLHIAYCLLLIAYWQYQD